MPRHRTPWMVLREQPVATLLVAVLALAGLVSASAGVYFAVGRSQDFQWSPERLLLRHLDPWRVALLGNPGGLLIGTQNPNYLPELYVLLLPFGWMSLHMANLAWALCNVGFAATAAVLAARFYGLRGAPWVVGITGAMLAAAPTRTSISNGQQGLLVLVLWAVALFRLPARAPGVRGLLLVGVSYLKYSFAPAVALSLLLRTGARRVLWTLVPPAIGTVLVWLWLDMPHTPGTLLQLVTEPLAVARAGYQPTGDPGQTLMDLLEFALGGATIATPRLTAICFAVAMVLTAVVLLAATRWLRRQGAAVTAAEATGWLVALMATMSFALYKHHPYDEVVFLFPLCHALRHRRQPAAMLALLLIADHWYLQRFVDARVPWSMGWAELRLASFLLLVGCVYFTRPAREQPSSTTLLPLAAAAAGVAV